MIDLAILLCQIILNYFSCSESLLLSLFYGYLTQRRHVSLQSEAALFW